MTDPADRVEIPAVESDPPPAEPPAIGPPAPAIHAMAFTGTGSEYFRIWIVNLALTIVTLGIYSAWAKVRRLQYFYRHTRLAGSGFDYHADPIAILKGRIVGLILFALYSAIGYVRLSLALTILAALALTVPWLLARSIKFRLHNSSYRGIRFRFSGRVRTAYWVFLGLPVLTVLSLFTVGPLWHHRIKRYQFANAAYGRTPFSFRTEVGEFYVAYVLAIAVMAAFAVVMGIALAAIGVAIAASAAAAGGPPDQPPDWFQTAFLIVLVSGYAIAALAIQAILAARLQNAVWNTTRLSGHGFICEVHWFRLFWIQFTNLLATVITLGLYRPFAQVRLARYVASVFLLVTAGPLDELAAAETEDVTAVGEEAAGFFDLDIGF